MIKSLGIASLYIGLALSGGSALAQAYYGPLAPPSLRYATPDEASAYPLYEGRSIYRMGHPMYFNNRVDEKGYPSGLPENPQSPN
ncbi:hypothetical protein [Methylocapsa acidiphila]|uniref:hypothetical protein n=1 Tax=Methylocapsa acidiphila TaxID=133552 RepID=UPI0004069B4C|nr:hypothetical protein [Methylocapsa acidiphila]